MSTAVEVEPKQRVFPQNLESWIITESVMYFPAPKSSPTTLSSILFAQAILLLLSNFSNIADVLALTLFFSLVKFLKHGVVKTAKNKANAPYTILLVGRVNAGKSSLMKFIANVLLGNDFDHYDLDILGCPIKRVVDQTASSHLYEITSVNGILVSSRVLNAVRRHNLFLRFASSTHLGRRWTALTVLSKIIPTKRVL